ncbi:N-acetylglucosaminyl-phosphatidylinositol de-N-acetylase isoform X2 [Electrophorus electricus]|uniref:N-acetylglucosaminyl-phosphatidylinositol de-N-acetylase isoform X2 n=1 Tax=Electrophorus electricus TaxID=8005 RepID=UPI0015CFC1AE|nr:N-acetylglucosaminyl-phosphatidylinositol de-N-acetylase isoform X2 [Electrophorus electricus]
MFVLLSIIFCCFVYLISVKLLYNRFKKLWPVLLNNVSLSPCTKKDLNVLSTYDRYDFNSRNSEKDNLHTLNDNRVLIVTAHPDDECMFFAPTILKLVESNALVHLLCLSSGNYYNQGDQRKKELVDSCAVLGIPANRVTIIDNKELPDDPKADWSTALISALILTHIRAHAIHLVLTFDEGGVSGHVNHIAIHKAFRLPGPLPSHHQHLQEVPVSLRTANQLVPTLFILLRDRARGIQEG